MPLSADNTTSTEWDEKFDSAALPYLLDLKKYCMSLAKSHWDGEDLMQETLMKAYKSWLKTAKPISKAYLFRIASNTWIDGYRKRKPDEYLHEDLSEFEQRETEDSTAVLEAMEVLLNELSSKQRVVTLLVEGFNYTAREAAKAIGSTEGAVKAALHRGRRKLESVNHDHSPSFSEEEDAVTYVTALRQGKPETFVRLYQEETQIPEMEMSRSRKVTEPHSMVQIIAGSNASYCLVSIPMKNGQALFVPFYTLELSALLSQLEGLTGEELLAA